MFLIFPLGCVVIAAFASIYLTDALYPHRHLKGDQWLDEQSAAATVGYACVAMGFFAGLIIAVIASKMRKSAPPS
jgi:hypothetical protein